MIPKIDVEKYKKSFTVASYDDTNDVSLVNDPREEVYILDDIAKEVEQLYEIDRPSSCDSLVIKGADIYLIEFKNRYYKSISTNDKKDIRKKAYQSRELLLSLFLRDKSVEYLAEHVQMLVVFKSMDSGSESLNKISESLNRLANGNTPVIRCKLSKFEGSYYKKVRTISKDDFEQNYMPQILT